MRSMLCLGHRTCVFSDCIAMSSKSFLEVVAMVSVRDICILRMISPCDYIWESVSSSELTSSRMVSKPDRWQPAWPEQSVIWSHPEIEYGFLDLELICYLEDRDPTIRTSHEDYRNLHPLNRSISDLKSNQSMQAAYTWEEVLPGRHTV